ncbi:MAG TPA: rhodanese-like domain-containing protein [Opitutaceae bacterium]|nr:rhodanese-like domain-containing protein [Opitutaceae bacterium]
MAPASRDPTAVDRSGPGLFRRAIAQAGLLLLAAVVAAVVTAWFHPPPPEANAREITLAQTRTDFVGEKILWVDARPSAAFSQEHIPGAVWLSEEAWDTGLAGFVEAWTPGRPVIVYCGSTSCGASRSVARRLMRELSVTGVFYLHGGWQSWKEEPR